MASDREQSEHAASVSSGAGLRRLPQLLAVPVSVSLLAGFLNVAISLYFERPPELEAASVAIQVAGLSVLFCLLLYAIVGAGLATLSWLSTHLASGAEQPGRLAAIRRAISVPGSTSAATSLVVVALGTLTPLALMAEGGRPHDLVRLGFLGFALFLAASFGYLMLGHQSGKGERVTKDEGPTTDEKVTFETCPILMAAPAVGLLASLATWWTAFSAGLSSAERSLVWIAAAILMMTVLGVCWAVRSRVGLLGFTAGFVVLLMIVGSFVTWSANAPLELPSFDTLSGRRPRHVILLTVDTLRADAVGALRANANGTLADEPSPTPRIDELAADSVVFNNARSPAPWTKPAVVSILTGLSPLVHEIIRGPTLVPDQLVTLPELMQSAGYRTGAVGENPFLHARYNFDQGFEEYQMFPKMLGKSFGGRLIRYLGTAFPSTADLTDMAVEWVEANADDPYFLWLHYFDPHPPYAPPADYLTGSGPPSIGASFGNTSGVRAGAVQLDAAEREWVEELYMAEVRYVDDNVGRFLDFLESSGLYDDALIIFSSDHGEEFWEHSGFEHGHSLYDEVIGVPLMVKLPGQTASGLQTAHVTTESILPTTLDLLDIEPEDLAFSAASLSWAWQPGGTDPMTPTVSTGLRYFEDRISVVSGAMKHIHWLVSGFDELYDLGQDPEELTSLTSEHPELVSEAQNLIARHEALSLQVRQLLGLPTTSDGVLDPAVLEQLRALGYIQ